MGVGVGEDEAVLEVPQVQMKDRRVEITTEVGPDPQSIRIVPAGFRTRNSRMFNQSESFRR